MYPNKTQEVLLNKTFGCCRFFWNKQVETFLSYNKETNPTLKFKTSTELRNEVGFLREVSAGALQQKEIDFKEFKSQYFSKTRKKAINKPKFKSKYDKQSYRLPNKKFSLHDDRIRLEKIGKVKIVQDRLLPEGYKLMSCTVSKDSLNHFYVSILVETNIQHLPKTNKSIGIDVGIKEFATLSDGTVINNPQYFRKSQAELKRSQQHLSRKKKGSNRYRKQKLKVAKVYKKVYRQRELFLHTTSLSIVKNYDVISIETLNVSGMLKNRKLSKSIVDASWSTFFNQLKYKCEWYGKELVQVGRWEPTSKTCSTCGHINKELTLKVREWECPKCHTHHERDLNAAINIQALGVSSAQRTQRECKTPLAEQPPVEVYKATVELSTTA